MLGSKSGLGLALLLFILALLQPISDTTFTKTINISYFESMESDFSNLQVFSISDEGAEPLVYTILEYSPGEWALLEISIPYDSERLLFTHFLLDNYEPVTISGKEVKYYFEKINGAGYIRLKDSFIENITIHNISASSNIEIFKDIIVSNDELENLRAFSFNPKNIESAEISIIAKGYFLFKCKDWNYTTQSCQGEWEYQFPITPGKPYTIHLNSLDPGYAESGPFIAFDDRGLTVTSNVYSSDNVYANKKASISYWVNGTWNMDILGDLNSANFKCELKVDLAALGTLYHEWFNSSSSSWKTICTKSTTIQITDTTHSCDVSSDLNTSESSHTLRCRIAFLLLKDISIDYISLDSDFQCVNLSNPSTYQNRVVNMSGIYYINDNVILCTDNYSTTDDLIRINASSITLDCGGSTLDGDDAGSDYGIDTQQNNYLEIKNCIITDFRSGIYTDANYSNFTNNTVYSNIEGFSVVSSSNNSFTNNTAHNNLKCGFSLSSSLNNTLTNNTANSNQDGFHLQSSSIYNTLINNTAQENLGCDLVIAISTAGDCNNLIENNTGSGGRPILYANESVTWSNLEASEVILCNADYSVITNVTVKGSDALDNNYFLLYHSDNLSISDSSSVNNLYGFYASYCSHNNFTNNTANSNNNYGFYIRYGSNNAFTNNTANYNNYGFYIRSSPSNIFTNNTADSNDNYGIYLYSTSDNKLTNNTASMNGRCGFTLYSSSNYNTLASNTVSSNERSGFYFYSSSGNNISNSIIINNSQRGMHLYGNSDNNTFENITLHGNAQSSSYYEIYFDRSGVIYPEYNTFTDIKLYNSTRYIGFDDQTHTNQNNFTNLSICYNSTIGCINWDFLNLTYANLANATTIILDPEFISLNTSNTGAAQFNSSANITIYAEDCAHPIYKASNFPDSRDSILSSGSKVNPIYNTCSNNIAVFSTVNDFSGYTKGYVGCVNLSNPSTYQNKVVNMSGIYYINDNVTLCTDNYSTTDDLIRINASSITLDCNGSTLDGDDAGDDYGIDTQGNDYLEIKNCIITDFESAISATGTTYSNFTNNTAISNTDGFIASSFNFNILLNNTATSNTKHGFHISSSSNNIFTNNTAQHNGYGFGIYTTSEYNTFTNNIAYSNNAGGFYLRTSTYSIFTNNTASSNSNGFYFYSSSSNNISNSIIINNLNRGIYLYRNSDNNTFENITLHGNAQSSSYEIYFDRNLADYPEHNTFTDIKLYNSTRYIGFDDQTHTNQNNFTNLSICYNSTIGCINWDFLNLTYANLANATTIILDPEFISLNTSNAGAVQFNSSANITVEVVSCIKPAEFIIRRLTEFPQSKNIILTSGQDYDPTSISCPSSTSIKFNISSFSGFAPLKAGITDCYTIAHPGDYWIVDDIDASSVNEVSARACINISSSNVNLNLNGFSIANGSNISGIFANGSSSYQYTNITIRDGTVTNFTHNSTIGPAYIGGIIFTYIENSSLSNLSVSYASKQTPAKVSTYGIFFDGSSYNSILNLTVHNNEQNGIRIESYSNYNNFSDIISLSNIGTGIRISSSLNNRIDQSTIYSNSGRGIHLDSSNYTMVLDTLTYDNSYGISLTSTSNNTLTNITSHTNSNGGFYSSASSGNNITNILSYNNTQEGFFITTSHFNKLENITTYTNSRRGLVLFLSNYNTLENITTYNNPWYGIFISSASNNNLINITSYNNSQHSLYIYANSDNNIFTDLTFYEDGKSPSYYEVYFGRNGVIYPEYNTFTDIKLYNSTRYIGFDDQTHTNQNNFTNLSICYNSTIGCINWDFLNLTYANLANATTIILDPEFISLNTSNAGAVQFNSSANITIYAEDCAHPIYKASNFPDSRDLILSSGSKVNPIYNTCSNNIAVFSTVNDFSGYTKGYAGCVNLSNPSTYQNKVVNMSGIYYINNDVILCTDNYSTTDDLIRINASFITLDCNDSILDGDNAGGDEGINTQQNNYLEIKNCIITDFERGIYLFNSTYNRIDNNNISNCINAGILISKSSNNTNITNNFITNTGGDAIKIDNSIYNWVYNNTLSNSNGMGVNCLISPYTTIEQNTISISQINGICIENTSYINVINNNISDSGYLDIVVAYAHYNNITSNEIHSLNDPGVFGGIVITAQSENNTIENNVLSGDSTENGIALSNTNYPTEPQYLKDLGSANVHNNIINNTITNYKKGIYVFNSTFNTFISNKVSLNNDTGFYLNISHNNSIYDNYFADNNKSVFDNGNNSWNTTYNCTGPANIIGGSCRGGNFYSDYSGMDNGMSLEPGHNYSLDGIGDQPLNYTILGGSAVDNLPLSNNASLYYLHKCRATSFCDEGTLSLSPLTSELEVALCSNFVSFRMREPALENTTIYISNIYYHTWFRGYNNSNISVGWQKYYNWSNQTDAYFYPTDKLVSEYLGFHLLSHIQSANISYANPGEINGNFAIKWARYEYSPIIWSRYDRPSYIMLNLPSIAVLQNGDSDGDGLSNYEELMNGTNPVSNDTDSDGLSDYNETHWVTDPNNPDVDNDGLVDGSDPMPCDTRYNTTYNMSAENGIVEVTCNASNSGYIFQDLNVDNGDDFTIRNCRILFNSTDNSLGDPRGITVLNGGRLQIYNSTIETYNRTYSWLFEVNGTTTLEDSTLFEMVTIGLHDSSTSIVNNCTMATWSGDNIINGKDGGNDIITNNTFMYCSNEGTGYPHRIITLSDTYNITISNNNFLVSCGSIGGIQISDNSHDNKIINNVVQNTVCFLDGPHANSNLSDNTIAYNNVSTSLLGAVILWGDNTKSRIIGNRLSGRIEANFADDAVIENNTIYHDGTFNYRGVTLDQSDNATIVGNHIYDRDIAIMVTESTNMNIKNNRIHNNTQHGIYVWDIDNSSVTNNTIHNSSMAGIFLNASSNNIITNNNISLNEEDGISLINSSYNNITENTLFDNSDNGIILEEESEHNLIQNNAVNESTVANVIIVGSNYNNIISNNLSNAKVAEMIVIFSGWITISDNELVSSSSMFGGIILSGMSSYCTINNNNISGSLNGNGISLTEIRSPPASDYIPSSCMYNNITNNTITNYQKGIDVFNSTFNIFTSNNVSLNNDTGFYLNISHNNSIYNNYFADNNKSVFDNGNNSWNTTYNCTILGYTNIIGGNCTGGNYWSDYNGTDNTGDGIGDTELPWQGSSSIQNGGDWLPLVPVAGPSPFLVRFTPPTPSNGTTVMSPPITINVSISGAAALNEVNFSWDNTTHGMYNSSLILMYNFDNIPIIGDNNTYVKDISNSSYDGVLIGDAHYVTGRYGEAINFDGDGDYLAIKNLHFDTTGEIGNLTVCVWFKTKESGGGTFDNWAFVDFDRSEYFNFFIRPNGLLGFGTTSCGGCTHDFYGSTPANDDEWHFGCAVFDSLDTYDKKLYLDGKLDNKVDAYSTGITLGTGTTRYGFIGDGSEAAVFNGTRNELYYNGTIDEVRIWNMSLSADQIQQQYFSNLYKYDADKWQLYIDQEDSDGTYDYYACASDLSNDFNCTEIRTITIDMFPPVITIISPEAKTYIADMIDFNVSLNKPGDWCGYSLDGPEKYNEMVAFWKFEKTAKDFAGSNHGTAYGVTDTAGYSGFAYNFDGDDYISIPNSYDINLGVHDKRTISAWFKVNDKDLDAKQVIYEEGATVRGLNIYVYNGSLYVGGWNEPAAESNWDGTWMNTSSISSNTWHHVVVRLDGTPAVQIDALKGYLDGANFANGSGSQLWSHSGDISIGRNGDTKFHDGDDGSLGEYFNGTIDEVIIYNDALTDTQIENIYNSTLVSMDKYSNTYFNYTKNMSGKAPHIVVFYCNDTHGNMGKSNKRYFAVDTVPPAISLEAPPHNSYLDYSNNIYFNFTAYAQTGLTIDTCELWGTWAGGWHNNYTWKSPGVQDYSNYTILNLTDGTFEWNVWCNDSNGNKDWAPQNFTLTVDIITPLISITYPENKTYTYPITELNYTYTEANPDVCWYSTDGGITNSTPTSCGNSFTGLVSMEGSNTWTVYIKDLAGHENSSNVTFTKITPDFDVIIESPKPKSYSTISIDFNVSLGFPGPAMAGDTCRYTLDDWASNITMTKINNTFFTHTNSSMPENTYTAKFWCNDTNGSINDYEEVSFAIDITQPNVTLVSPAPNYTTSALYPINIIFECNATDNRELRNISLYITNSSNQSFSLNQTTAILGVSNSSSWTLELVSGNYTWNCIAYDTAGNSDWGDKNRTVTINAIPILVNFTPPTLPDGTTVISFPIPINVSILGAASLKEVNFSWDNTIYGMYNDDLILMYNFDNISIIGDNDTHIKDISNSNYDGAIRGNTHYVTGRYGKSASFDGSGDYIAIKDLYYNSVGAINNITICIWFKTSHYGGGTFDNWAFVDFDRSEYFNFFIRSNNGLLGFGTTNSSGSTNDLYGSTPANDDEWHFGCAVFDSSETLDKRLYLDANLENEVNAYPTGVKLGTGTTRYGFIGDGSEAAVFDGARNNFYYDGLIDEVRIWNMSLSADQIQQQYFSNLYKYDADKWQLYIDQEDSDGTYDYYACASDLFNNLNCTETRTITMDMFPPIITIISPEAKTYIADMIDFNVSLNKPGDWCGYSLDGPEKYNEMVAFWKFEKTAKDFAGSNHGTAYGVTDTAGYSGFAYNFDGDDYISIPNSYDINLGTHDKRTISAWFKVNDKDLDAKQVIYEEGGASRGLNIYVYNGSLYVGGWNEPVAESNWDGTWMNTSSISSNTWHHVVVRLDGTPAVQIDALKGYLDGANFANGSGSQLWSHSGDISIGRNGDTKFHDGDDNSLGEYFNGTIDEVIIYNNALTDTQIENIYNSTLVSMDKYSNTYFNHTKNMSGEAPYVIVFYCNDTHGNMGKSNKRYFAVDTVPPAISLEAPPHNSYLDYSNNIYFNFTAYSLTELDTCELWGTWAGGWHKNYTWVDSKSANYSNYTILNLTDGTFEWNVWCNETTGISDWAPQNFTLTVDIITPLISITYPENKTYTYPITELNYTYTEANPDVCWYSTDGGITNSTPTSCGNSFTGLVSMEGSNTWTVYIKDLAGHENSSNVTFTKVTPDFDVIIESPKPKSYSTISIDFNVSLGFPGPAMAGDTCRYTLDDWASNITMTKINATFFTHTNSSMPENTYTAKFWCNDTNGKINDYEEVNFSVDITPPTYSNDFDDSSGSVVEGTIVNTAVYWQDNLELNTAIFRTNQSGSWLNISGCSLSGTSSWCNKTIDTTGSAGKRICWNQHAKDDAVNWNNTMPEATHCFNVTYLPNVTLVAPPPNYWNDTSDPVNVSFECNATGNSGLVNISLYITNSNNQSFALNQTTSVSGKNASANWTLLLPNGDYTWNCLAYDVVDAFDWGDENRSITINLTSTCNDSDGDGFGVGSDTSDCPYPDFVDCNDADPFIFPPHSGLELDSSSSIYTLCSGTYYINSTNQNPVIIIKNDNITLNCNWTKVIGNRVGTFIRVGRDEATVKNGFIINYSGGIVVDSSSHIEVYGNILEGCIDAISIEDMNNSEIYNNSIRDSEYGLLIDEFDNSFVYNNTIDSSLFGYYASNQYLNYSGEIFDNNQEITLFIQKDIFDTGGEPCVVDEDNASLFACPGFSGTENLSVMLNDLSSLGFGSNATIIINMEAPNCSVADDWWDTELQKVGAPPGMHPPCYHACILYIANGYGNNYALNESCYNATVNVSGELTYPPYVYYGKISSYGIELTSSAGNAIYNNIFRTTYNTYDDNNGYFQGYFASFSPVTYNGRDYLGDEGDNFTRFLYDVHDGEMGHYDRVGFDNYELDDDELNIDNDFGMFVANFSDSYDEYATIYFDKDNIGWNNCSDVENDLYNELDSGDCHAFCSSILISNGYGQNYTVNTSCLNTSFNITAGYTYPPYLNFKNYSVELNKWNITQQSGPNIIGGVDIGGNYYSDYLGVDIDWDGIGETSLPYSIPGGGGSDYLPLTSNQNVTECFYANTSNVEYILSANLIGNKSDGACITINATNVTINGNGYSITGNSLGTTYGVYCSNHNRATIENCIVINYTYGILIQNSSNDNITNVIVRNSTTAGLLVNASDSIFVDPSYFCNNSGNGIEITNTNNSVFSQVIACNNTLNGIFVNQSINITINASAMYGNSRNGLRLEHSHNSTIRNSTAYSNHVNGIYMPNCFYNIIDDMTTYSNSPHGIFLDGSSNNTLTNITSYDNSWNGIFLVYSSNNTLTNITSHDNTGSGIVLDGEANHNNCTYAITHDNGWHGVFLGLDCQDNNFRELTSYNNTHHGIFLDASNGNNFTSCIVYNNSMHGLCIDQSDNIMVNLLNIYNNSQHGVYSSSSSNTVIKFTNITDNLVGGVYFDSSSSGSSLSENRVCFNDNYDINNENDTNTGQLDHCDSFSNWNENGHLGCTYSCYEVWHLFFGNVSGEIVLGLNESQIMYDWSWQSSDGGKLYVANGDASISWEELEPLGRNTSSQPSSSDFEEADTVLFLTNYSDNINNTYSTDGSAPKYNTTMELHKRTLSNIPYVNTTNSSTFITAITWDASDTIGDAEFDPTDNEDLVFVTNITSTTSGKYGDYNYEIRIPSTLDTYKGASGVVYFYLELT